MRWPGRPKLTQAPWRSGRSWPRRIPAFPSFRRAWRKSPGLGWHRLKSGEPSEAVDYFSREEAIWKKLADANPSVKDYTNSLANCQTNGATVLIRLGRAAEARTRCEAAVAVREALATAEPNVPQYRKNLAESLLRFGQVRQAAGDLGGASADWRRAVDLLKSIAGLDGEYIFYWAGCHASLLSLGGEEKDAHPTAMALLRQAAGMGTATPEPSAPRRCSTRFADATTFG